MPTVVINKFNLGITNDPRDPREGVCRMVKHFDFWTNPYKLIPFFSSEADETKSFDIVRFLFAAWGSNTRLYGYGKASGSSAAAVYIYDITEGTPDTTNWATPANNEGSTINRTTDVFFEYKNYIYMWSGGTKLGRYGDISATPSFTDDYKSINYTNIAQPVHHPADDIAYFFSDNKIHTLNDTTFVENALVLPDNLIIKSATPFGNYLAIGCETKTTLQGNSIVFLWDRDSSVTTLAERIDFGEGKLKHLAELDGVLIGVIDYFSSSFVSYNRPKIIFKKSFGKTAFTINEILGTNTVSVGNLPAVSQVKENRLVFPLEMEVNGIEQEGIWSVDSEGRHGIEIIEEDASPRIKGFWVSGNNWFIAHSGDGSVNRTDNNGTFGFDSTYESTINPQMPKIDRSRNKQLDAVEVSYKKLPSSGQCIMKYKVDGATNFTTVFTETTDNAMSTDTTLIAAGTQFTSGIEYEFQIISTGGAEITGFKYKYSLLKNTL